MRFREGGFLMQNRLPRRHRALPMVVSLAFVASLIGWSAPATSAATLCATPPPVVDVSSLTPGTTGTAWTVVEGTAPVSFDVEVLGVLPDGIAPGIDFILIQVSGPVIDETGGIAAGMSGSPVYVGGDLAGAISYGFFGADPTIGGMTPAASMVHILDFPQPPSPAPVRMDATLQRAFARASDATTVAAAPTVAKPITVPLSVSGLGASSGKAQSRLQHWMTKNGSPFAVTTGASAQAPGGAPLGAPPVAGGAIGAAYSYGDATFGAIGTATFVCDDEVVAFGHPFNHSGETTLALTNANIIHTIPDPSQVFGAFKFGQITDTSGIVTQDRLAGIAGITGTAPALTPVTSDLTYTPLGRSDQGSTQVVTQEYLPYISYAHTYYNVATITDADGPGSGTLDLTVNGTDEAGDPWTVSISDTYSSEYNLADEVGYYGVYRTLSELVYQRFEDVNVDSVDISGSLSDDDLTARVKKVLSRTNQQHTFKQRHTIQVHRGGRIDLRVVVLPTDSDTPVTVDIRIDVPGKLRRSGDLLVIGGGFRLRDHVKSFAELVDSLNHQPKQSDVSAAIFGRGLRDPKVVSEPSGYVLQGVERLNIKIVH